MDKNKDWLHDLWQISGVNEDIWATLIDTYNNATTKEDKDHAFAHIKWHLGHRIDNGKFSEIQNKIYMPEYIDLDLPSKTLWAPVMLVLANQQKLVCTSNLVTHKVILLAN